MCGWRAVAANCVEPPAHPGPSHTLGMTILEGTRVPDETEELSLLETIDHLLDRGVVIAGEAIVSIGDVDLLYLGLNVVLANVDAVQRTGKR